jgi:hypothetical protein
MEQETNERIPSNLKTFNMKSYPSRPKEIRWKIKEIFDRHIHEKIFEELREMMARDDKKKIWYE